MKALVSIAAAVGVAAAFTGPASAADLYDGDYEVGGVVVEDGPVVVERERFIERRYYGARDYVEDVPAVEAYYPDRHYWRAHGDW